MYHLCEKYKVTTFSHRICHVLNIKTNCSYAYRARRRKKLAKALERQARKLRAKGITVDIEALKSEYLSQHRINASDTEGEDDEEDPIDVVGGDSCDDEPEDCSMQRRDSTEGEHGLDDHDDSDSHKNSIRPINPFSIESLLYNNT